MLNLLRSDFYRFRRSKSYFITLALLVLIVAYIIIDFRSLLEIKEQYSPTTFHWIYMLFKEKGFLPYFIPVFQAIFITMFISNEYSTGTIKDPVSLGFSRIKVYLSKLITVSIGTIIMMLLAVITTAISSLIVFGLYGTFTLTDLILFIRMFFIQTLLYTAYGSLFLMIAFLIKNIGGTMAFNIFASLILGSLSSLFGNGYIGRLVLLMNFSPTAVSNPEAIDLIIAIVVGLSYLLISITIGGFTFYKQDIK